MYGSDGIVNFQFHQTKLDEIVLSIVPGPGNAAARAEKDSGIDPQIRAVSPGHPIRIEVREVESIPLSSAGKVSVHPARM